MKNTNNLCGESGYLALLESVIKHGNFQESRAGNIYCLFDGKLWFDERNPPIFRSRKINYRYSFEEFWFFLNGKTQTKELEEKGIKFWQGNTSREFLDNRGLHHLPEGDMGKAYGYQFRNYQDHVDQLTKVYELLKNDPTTRRAYVTFWNPSQEQDMALPPCWHSHQFVVIGDTLNLKVLNRSLDVLYGAPFAVFQYWVYFIAMAKLLNLKVGFMSCDLSHIHVYENQVDYIKEYLTHSKDNIERIINPWWKDNSLNVEIKKDLNSLDDLLNLKWDDIAINGLEQLDFKAKAKKPKMAV